MTWRAFASCRDLDPNDFIIEAAHGINDRYNPEIVAAKAVCAECPVSTQCLNEGMSDPDIIGIWGGKTRIERLRMMGHRYPHNIRLSKAEKVPFTVGIPPPLDESYTDNSDPDSDDNWYRQTHERNVRVRRRLAKSA